MAICANCGATIPDDVQFCGECGAPVQPAQQPAQPQPAYGYRQAAQMQAQQPPQGYAPQGYGYGAPVQPRVSFIEKLKGFFAGLKGEPTKPLNYGLLMILSIVFVVMFLLFSLGLGGKIFYNRNIADSSTTPLSARGIFEVGQSYSILYRQDVKKYLKNQYSWKSDYKYSDLSTEEIDEAKKALRKADEQQFEKYGFRYTMSKFGCLVAPWFLWIGIAGMVIVFAFWWINGGRFKNISQTAVVPVLYAAVAVFLLLLLLNGSIATCYEW